MASSRNIVVEKTPQAAAIKAAEIFRGIVTEAVTQRDACDLAVSGGTTPHNTYAILAEQVITDGVPWPKVQVFFGDEHDVSHDDIDSNYHMVQRTLLDHTPINWKNVHPMQGDAENLELVASEYEQMVRKLVRAGEDGIPQFDLIMLGMGGDGHTASLFPNHPVLEESRRLVVSCHVPVLGRNRITFTYPLINSAQNILLLVTGDDKAEVVQRVFQDCDQTLPSARVSPKHGTFHIVLDMAAARLL